MALSAYVESLLGGLPSDLKRVLTEAFRYVVPNTRFGQVDHQLKSESFNAFYVVSTTATSTGEFSIVHGLGRAPYLALPLLRLDSSGGRIVPLTVTRVADRSRVYLKTEAGSTGALFNLFLE